MHPFRSGYLQTPIFAAICATLFLIGCRDSSSKGTLEYQSAAPSLHCATTAVAGVGVPFVLESPSFASDSNTASSGTGITYYLSPSLPSGLSMNSSTGTISGVPTGALSATSYTYLATNSVGESTCSFNLSIDATAPTEVVISRPAVKTFTLSDLSFSWTTSTDSDFGIRKYQYSVGTQPSLSDVVEWTDNGSSTSKNLTLPATLNTGKTFYFNVKAISNSGLSTVSSSDAITYVNQQGIFARSLTATQWGVDSNGDPVATATTDELFFCTSTSCTRVHYLATDLSSNISTLASTYGSHGVFWVDYLGNPVRYCTEAGCSSLTGFTALNVAGVTIGGFSAQTTSGVLANCFEGTCTALPLNPVTSWTAKTPAMRFGATAGASYLNVLTPTLFSYSAVPNGGVFSGSTTAYSNDVNKIWAYSTRSAQYYLLSCSVSGCQEVANIGASTPSQLITSLFSKSAWLKYATSLYLCSETSCSSAITIASGYGLGYVTPTVEGIWFFKAAAGVYCTTAGCSSLTGIGAGISTVFGYDGAGTGLWTSNASNLKYCTTTACTSVQAVSLNSGQIALNSRAAGLWYSNGSGINYCTSSGCSVLDNTSTTFVPMRSNTSSEGAWFYDTASYAVKYCSKTSCLALPKPATMLEIAY